jgi:hypothetical protein
MHARRRGAVKNRCPQLLGLGVVNAGVPAKHADDVTWLRPQVAKLELHICHRLSPYTET